MNLERKSLAVDPAEAKALANCSGEAVSACFQCQKCTSGCTMADEMDLGPSKVMRCLQLGLVDKVLKSTTIWLCAGCYACSMRCPNGIDVARVMDALRQEAMRRKLESPKENIRRFHELLLKSVARHGRSFETGLVVKYARGQGELLKNAVLGMVMFLKGKMPILPKKVSDRRSVKKLLRRPKHQEG